MGKKKSRKKSLEDRKITKERRDRRGQRIEREKIERGIEKTRE